MALNPINRQVPPPVGIRWASDGGKFRRWADDTTRDQSNALQQFALGTNLVVPAYGPTVKIDLSHGSFHKVTATDGNAFTISAPVNLSQLAHWVLVIQNASGGALGAVTFASGIHQSGFSAPANGQRTTVQFYIETGNPPNHYQVGSWSPAF